MIFPVCISEEYTKETYVLKETDGKKDLFSFYSDTVNGNNDIKFSMLTTLEKEEYIIKVGSDGIRIKYSTEEGKFRALTSLWQLISYDYKKVSYCRISDKPQYLRRGYMLDISRCRIPKLETILWLVDILAQLKYNELQLYMDSFCYKYEAFPEYTADFDCLDSDDIEYLDNYCKKRFIDLVPHQNSFGHMAAWLEKPELAHLGLSDGTNHPNTLNPLIDETIEFLDKLYASLLPHLAQNMCA